MTDQDPETADEPDSGSEFKQIGAGISRAIDKDAGVVLYRSTGYRKAALTCVPLSETDLEADDA